MFAGQSFDTHDLVIIALLVVLEGVLSIDNALVLGILAKRLPKHQQRKALTYGLVGAFVFRFIAIGMAAYLLRWTLVKLIGGAYLVYIAVKHFFFDQPHEHASADTALASAAGGTTPHGGFDRRFWGTVMVIEITDIAFAIDSILAAIGLVKGPEKTWVVVAGGFIGVIMMRFAAVLFIKLLERFPRFEQAAYLLVLLIGAKLCVDWAGYAFDFHKAVDFHNMKSPAFWVFWTLMFAFFCVGFLPSSKKTTPSSGPAEPSQVPANS